MRSGESGWFIGCRAGDALARWQHSWREVFQLCEHRLAGKAWALGERYSLADIHLFRLFWRWMNSGGPPSGTFPGVSAHYDRMMTRPAVRRVLEIESAIGYELPA